MSDFDYLVECERYYERELAQRDEELRELIQQWRERASELFHDENSLCELQRSDELHKCADELEAKLDDQESN